jgi:hypothetical protein
MTIQDQFEQQLQLTTRHTAQHLLNINPPTTVDHSCRICYPHLLFYHLPFKISGIGLVTTSLQLVIPPIL